MKKSSKLVDRVHEHGLGPYALDFVRAEFSALSRRVRGLPIFLKKHSDVPLVRYKDVLGIIKELKK